jgi:hypothetical protein
VKKVPSRKLIDHINRKHWWHVPPVDPDAYMKRGMFFASSFGEAEFYGRPLNEPGKVAVSKPLVGDERTIARVLRIPLQHDGMTLAEIAAQDGRWRKAALKNGYDAILLMTPKGYAKWKTDGKLPRSLELNILTVDHYVVATKDR